MAALAAKLSILAIILSPIQCQNCTQLAKQVCEAKTNAELRNNCLQNESKAWLNVTGKTEFFIQNLTDVWLEIFPRQQFGNGMNVIKVTRIDQNCKTFTFIAQYYPAEGIFVCVLLVEALSHSDG